jgi:hypothetical protein
MPGEKHSDARRHGGPGASHENRRNPAKSKPRAERSNLRSQAGKAAARGEPTNVDQQGDRANVRQNTTRQGNRRSA